MGERWAGPVSVGLSRLWSEGGSASRPVGAIPTDGFADVRFAAGHLQRAEESAIPAHHSLVSARTAIARMYPCSNTSHESHTPAIPARAAVSGARRETEQRTGVASQGRRTVILVERGCIRRWRRRS